MVDEELEPLEVTREVVLVRLASFAEEPLERCTELELGDELRCASGTVAVGIRCPGGSEVELSGRFRVALVPSGNGEDCTVDLRSGAVQVDSTEPTGVEAGPTGAGARRTRYEVRFESVAGEAAQAVTVFDGEVEVRAAGIDSRRTMTAGERMVHQGTEWEFGRLRPLDARRGARVSARLAAGSASRAEGVETRAVYRHLVTLYSEILTRPDDPAARLELAEAQLHYRLPEQALRQLDQAAAMGTRQPEIEARIPLAQARAYELLDRPDQAELFRRRAANIDPDILRRREVVEPDGP